MRIEILGVPIDAVRRTEAIQRVSSALDEQRFHQIVTPNPEMLVDSTRDPRFREILRSAYMNVPDGFGLVLAALFSARRLIERIPGVDLVEDICAVATEKEKRVYLLGGTQSDVAQKCAEALVARHPGLEIIGAESGGAVREINGRFRIDETVLERVRRSRAEILMVGFGHVKQERWIADNRSELPDVQLAIGVGGTFDFLSGEVRRAPRPLRKIGLEWLWRLILQPWRFRRIWKAVAVFPWLVLVTRNDKIIT